MLATYEPNTDLSTDFIRMAEAGQAANRIAARNVLADFQERKAPNTNRRHAQDLNIFGQYLAELGLYAGDLFADPGAWRGITWGIVSGFVKWSAGRGYSIGSINMHLSTVKVYARLAAQALDTQEHVMIGTVKGYSRKEGKRLDDTRAQDNQPTRNGIKKAAAVSITAAQAAQLKSQPNTPQGRRDKLMTCIMLDHGLRVGEVVILKVTDFDLSKGTMTFYRPKVDKVQTHRLTADTLTAARAYFTHDAPALGCAWRSSASKQDGKELAGSLTEQGATERGMTKRVNTLGERIGIIGLSAHDLRHFWATDAARNGTPIDVLMWAGGWNSYAMPLRYIERAKIANAGVKLSE